MAGQVGTGAAIPFGISEGARQRLAVGVLGGEVEVELQPGGGGLADLAQRDLVQIVGGLFRIVVVIVLDPAVEVEEFGPAEDRLEAVEDQAVVAVRLVGLVPPRALGRAFALFGGAIGIAGLDFARSGRLGLAQIEPQRDGEVGAIARGRGGCLREVAAVDRGQ